MDDMTKLGVVLGMTNEYQRILTQLEKDVKTIAISNVDSKRLKTDPEYCNEVFNSYDPVKYADIMAKSYLKAAIAMAMVQKKVNETV